MEKFEKLGPKLFLNQTDYADRATVLFSAMNVAPSTNVTVK